MWKAPLFLPFGDGNSYKNWTELHTFSQYICSPTTRERLAYEKCSWWWKWSILLEFALYAHMHQTKQTETSSNAERGREKKCWFSQFHFRFYVFSLFFCPSVSLCASNMTSLKLVYIENISISLTNAFIAIVFHIVCDIRCNTHTTLSIPNARLNSSVDWLAGFSHLARAFCAKPSTMFSLLALIKCALNQPASCLDW